MWGEEIRMKQKHKKLFIKFMYVRAAEHSNFEILWSRPFWLGCSGRSPAGCAPDEPTDLAVASLKVTRRNRRTSYLLRL